MIFALSDKVRNEYQLEDVGVKFSSVKKSAHLFVLKSFCIDIFFGVSKKQEADPCEFSTLLNEN